MTSAGPGVMAWKRWLWVVLGICLAIGLYAVAGFWGVPKLIHAQAGKYVREELRRELRIGEVKFNPFTFVLQLRDVAILEKGRPLVALGGFRADYQASSLFSRTHTLREIAVDRPYARAIILPDGSLNLAELLPESEPDAPVPSVLVQSLAIREGKVDFADRSRPLEPTKSLAPITFSLVDLRTGGGDGTFKLDTRTEDGEGLAWQGRLSLQPVASSGRFELKGLKATSVHEFLAEELPMVLAAGDIDLAGNYTFAVRPGNGVQLDATLPRITARGLALRARGNPEDWVSLPMLTLEGTRLSLARREAEIAALRIAGMKAKAWLEADGSMNLEQLLSPPVASAPQAPVAATAGGSGGGGSAAEDWTLRLAELSIEDASVQLEDRTVRPAGKFELAPLSASVRGISLDLAEPVPITVATRINGKSPLQLEGDVVPSTLAADLQVQVSALPMTSLLMYLPDYPSLVLRSGMIDAAGKLTLRPETDPGPALRYDGQASVVGFDLGEKSTRQPLVSWDRLDLLGIAYAEAPDSIRVKRISARKPRMQVVIAPDGTINLARILAAPTAGTAQAQATGALEVASLPAVEVAEILLEGGTMDFADFSINPGFEARIDALRGRISGVSTAPGSSTQLALAGHVIDRYSPVTIEGRLRPLAYDEMTDIAMTFRNIELPIFNPYSGRFAGYAIAKGKLTTELHYTIDQRKLKADHHVVIDQLQWGQATDSKEKVSLPIRLATSLLKDSRGVIELDLPVGGTLDDPKFRIGPVVWQIVKNLVVKVATAPFRFLGSMFKGAEDAQFVDFAPGSAELTDKARTALPELANGLADRPEVMLDIPAGSITEADAAALDERAFLAAVTAKGQGKGKGKADAAAPYGDMQDGDKIDLLVALYRQEFQRDPVLPEPAPTTTAVPQADAPAAAATATADATPSKAGFSPIAAAKAGIAGYRDRRDARKRAEVEWLESQLRPRFKADPSAGAKLAQARAKAVQDALLAPGKLDPQRVFLAGNLLPVSEGGMTRLELQLK